MGLRDKAERTMTDQILFEKRDGGAFATFNRPEVRNALNPEIIGAIAEFLHDIRDDPAVRYLVFQGNGEHFSAGGDLASYAEKFPLGRRGLQSYMRRRVRSNAEAFFLLESLPMPVISVVRGAAAGGGLSFVLGSDFVLAADNCMMIFAQPKVGLPLDIAATYFLPRVVGIKQARKLAMTGATITAQEAHALGIVDEVHPADGLDAALAALVKRFSAVAPRAAGRTKLLLNQSFDNSITQQFEAEVLAIGACVGEPDFAEGVTAFLEKRKAQFSGKAD